MARRLFLPPYMQPVEPNVPKQIVAGYTELGNYMAREMRAASFSGITTNSTYDAWSPRAPTRTITAACEFFRRRRRARSPRRSLLSLLS